MGPAKNSKAGYPIYGDQVGGRTSLLIGTKSILLYPGVFPLMG